MSETDLYAQPQEVSDVMLVFPANLKTLLPPYALIPEEFKHSTPETYPWVKFVSDWFFSGWPKRGLIRSPDVDATLAHRHLSAILGSFEPKHEHKEAAVAWLASRWFKDIGPVD